MSTTASRIGELKLHLRIPSVLEAEAPRLRAMVERTVVVKVIEELERRLHAVLGGSAVVRVRRLALRWSLDAGALDDLGALTRLADELARDLLAEVSAQPPVERLRPRSPSIVVFAGERHVDAARLADVADGMDTPWFHAGSPDAASTWTAVAEAGAAEVVELMRWLERMERVEAALALAPDRALDRVAEAVPARLGEVALVRARRAMGAVVSVDAQGMARGGFIDDGSQSAPVMATDDARANAGPHATAASTATTPAAVPLDAAAVSPPIDRAAGQAAIVEGGEAAATAATSGSPELDALRPATDRPAAPSDAAPAAASPVEPSAIDDVSVATEHAGLFYLVARVLEIDLAEALWAAGVAEGDFLAHVARVMLDRDADPAWRWFGGAFDRVPPLPAIPGWAAEEVSTAVQHSLGRRLAAFDVVCTPAELASELGRLASSAPARPDGDLVTAELVARAAAALAMMVAARLCHPPSWELLAEVLRRPGQLVVTDDAVRVVMAAGAIDLDHRRAGLDQNVGHVPWWKRGLVIEFAGGETL